MPTFRNGFNFPLSQRRDVFVETTPEDHRLAFSVVWDSFRRTQSRYVIAYVGASLVTLATFELFLGCRWFVRQFWLPSPFQWQSLGLLAVAIGAAAGACSPIVLDSVMHFDMTPFAPFSDTNPLFRLTSLPALHWFGLGSGPVALLILGIRKVMVSQNAR